MIITTAKINKVLQNNKQLFNPSIKENELSHCLQKISSEILSAPVIQESQWIEFVKMGSTASGKTSIFNIYTKDDIKTVLGQIRWASQFRSYAFFPMESTFYEPQCLNDIINFIEALMILKAENKSK